MATKKTETPTDGSLQIQPPNLRRIAIQITGTAPLVQNKFSAKVTEQIAETQRAGSQAKSKKKREPKDFDALFLGARHVSEDGWIGVPAPAFRSAMIDACRLVGFVMTRAKLSVFVQADGLDAEDGTPLVRLQAGEPERLQLPVRNESGVVDIRVRPMWRRWACTLRITFDGDQFSEQDIVNLLERAGQQVGIGEGRPSSKKSHGMGWGLFTCTSGDA
jgi:hypothetical protein